MIAFELSIFDDINSVSGFTYGRTRIFLSLLEVLFFMLLAVSSFCTNNFFNLKFILLKIRTRGYPLSSNNFIYNSKFFLWKDGDSFIARSRRLYIMTAYLMTS